MQRVQSMNRYRSIRKEKDKKACEEGLTHEKVVFNHEKNEHLYSQMEKVAEGGIGLDVRIYVAVKEMTDWEAVFTVTNTPDYIEKTILKKVINKNIRNEASTLTN